MIFHCTDHLAQKVGPADEEWLKEGVHVHKFSPTVKRGVEVRTPLMYMTSRMQLNEHWGFKRGDPLGWGLIFVAGLVLCEPEDFRELHESVLGGFPVLHKSFSSGPVFIAWSEQLELHVLVRNAISNL